MSFSMFVTWVLLGVLGGVLAGLLMKRGGYGLKPDIYIGLIGSIGLSWLFRAIGLFPNAGIVAMAFVAFIGAALAIVAQRTLRHRAAGSGEGDGLAVGPGCGPGRRSRLDDSRPVGAAGGHRHHSGRGQDVRV